MGQSKQDHIPRHGGTIIIDIRYTYMCLPIGANFVAKFWYSDRGFLSETKELNLQQIGCILGKLLQKTPNLMLNWVLFFRKWYTDRQDLWQKIGIEIVRFSSSDRHI